MAKVINSKQVKVKKIMDAIVKIISDRFKKKIGDPSNKMDSFDIFVDPILPKK
jgi:hypothetical protein